MGESIQLEHANITVGDIDAAIHFLTTAFPEFAIRGGARTEGGQNWDWVHVGTDATYIALSSGMGASPHEPYATPGVNHLGFAVEDVEALRTRLLDAGYREGFVPEPHPHRRRVYFHDSDGLEWEFVQYFSDDPRERNDYS